MSMPTIIGSKVCTLLSKKDTPRQGNIHVALLTILMMFADMSLV